MPLPIGAVPVLAPTRLLLDHPVVIGVVVAVRIAVGLGISRSRSRGRLGFLLSRRVN